MTDAHAQGPMEQWVRDPTNIRHHLGEGGYLTHERCGGSCKVIEAARRQDDIQRQLVEALAALADYVEDDNPGAVGGDAWVGGLIDAARAALARVREEGTDA